MKKVKKHRPPKAPSQKKLARMAAEDQMRRTALEAQARFKRQIAQEQKELQEQKIAPLPTKNIHLENFRKNTSLEYAKKLRTPSITPSQKLSPTREKSTKTPQTPPTPSKRHLVNQDDLDQKELDDILSQVRLQTDDSFVVRITSHQLGKDFITKLKALDFGNYKLTTFEDDGRWLKVEFEKVGPKGADAEPEVSNQNKNVKNLPLFDMKILLNHMREANVSGEGVVDLKEIFFFPPYAGGKNSSKRKWKDI